MRKSTTGKIDRPRTHTRQYGCASLQRRHVACRRFLPDLLVRTTSADYALTGRAGKKARNLPGHHKPTAHSSTGQRGRG